MALRDFIESRKESVRALRLSLLFASVMAALYSIRIMGLALFADGIGSIWRYKEQSIDEHTLRLCRAVLGLSLVVI